MFLHPVLLPGSNGAQRNRMKLKTFASEFGKFRYEIYIFFPTAGCYCFPHHIESGSSVDIVVGLKFRKLLI